jgi:basic membrane protein A
MPSHPRNVRGLLFKEQEAGYLVGYLAGLVVAETAGSNQTVSSVGGQKIPPVDRYIAGYEAGAEAANPNVTTIHGYSQDFVDQARCKEVALNQIARGSAIVFQVAGQCGLGALNAAKEQNVLGIGVDADQGFLGEHVLTSALKKVDVAVYQTIQAVQEGTFVGGEDTVFDVASGGVGLGEIAPSVPATLVAQVKQVQEQIAAGGLRDAIPETVK